MFGAVLAVGVVFAVGAAGQMTPDEARHERSAVYPPHGLETRFDHALHAAQFECVQCHEGVRASTHSAQEHTPRMEDCARCHPQVNDTEDGAACSFCHDGYRPLWPEPGGLFSVRDPRFPLSGPEPSVPLRPNLVFAHSGHGAIDCAHCHVDEGTGGASLPREATCLDCHQREGTQLSCVGCHPAREDGNLEVRLPANARTGEQQLRPVNHDAGWGLAHAAAVGADPTSCFACHSDNDCLSCHQAMLGIDSRHPPGYRSHHAMDARRQSSSCAACHEASSFCVDCHIDAGVHDISQADAMLGGRFHREGWVESPGGEHGIVAQHGLFECASCHQESTCAECHVDVSPHGSGFLSRCSDLLDAEPGMCHRCHGALEIEGLRSRCR